MAEKTERYLMPRVDRDGAARLLAGRRTRLLRRRVTRIELLYLPVDLVEAKVVRGRTDLPSAVLFAVDAVSGDVRRAGAPGELPWGTSPSGSLLPARLTSEESLSRAHAEIPWVLLRFSLRGGRRRIRLGELTSCGRVGYPCWVAYFARRGRYFLDAVDGLSGRRLGARGRAAIIEAILSAARASG